VPKFLIEVPHEADTLECTRVVHVFLSTGSHFLTNAEWGSKSGVHSACRRRSAPMRASWA
jgi:hypothetical protein